MEWWSDSVFLSRLQFAFTALFHIVWPVLTIGLSLFLVLLEALWLKTRDRDYYLHARFWSKLLLLNFSVGVVSGITLEFAFGTNWAPFSLAAGDFIGNILGFEGAMAFMLEAGFLGIALFGWQRVPPAMHFFATCMVALGASLSAFWIMVANAWMQTPAGVVEHNGVWLVESYRAAIFNPAMPTSVMHMWLACLETSLLVIGGISAWYLRQARHPAFFLKSFRLAVGLALLIMPLQLLVGDAAGRVVAQHQPAKLAAIEGHWQTNPAGQGAPWVVLAWPDAALQSNRWAVQIPHALSLLTTGSLTGQVPGLGSFPRDQQPPVWLPFYSFRFMVLIGLALIGLVIWSGWHGYKRNLTTAGLQKPAMQRLLRAWVWAIPLGYIAVQMGWITREVGRQPWVIYGLLRTQNAASELPAAAVLVSLAAYVLIYAVLAVVFIVFARRWLRAGPDMTLSPPRPADIVAVTHHG